MIGDDHNNDTLPKIIAESNRFDETNRREQWRLFSSFSGGGRSSLGAILAMFGILLGAISQANAGGIMPIVGGIAGGLIFFAIGRAITMLWRLFVNGLKMIFPGLRGSDEWRGM